MGDAGDDSTEPSVSFTAPSAGRYAFHVEMSSCSASRCAFAIQVLTVEGKAAALLATDGTCFAVGPDGTLLTAAHVIEDARRITVAFPGRQEEPAEVVRSDADVDLALLRIHRATPDYLVIPKESPAHMGDRVFTVGYPAATLLGASPKFAEGSVSSLVGGGENDSLIQITVPVQPGNSGGPVVDEEGQLVGIVSATAEDESFYQETGAYPQNVSFAVKAELAGELAPAAPPLPAAGSRAAVIARVSRATCRVLVR
jgi:S1-C subfamily serine protease